MTIDKPHPPPYSENGSVRDGSSSSERSHAHDVLPPPYSENGSVRGRSPSSERSHAHDVVRDSSPTKSSDSGNPGPSTDATVGERKYRDKGKQKETTDQQAQRMRENQHYYDELTSLPLNDMVSRIKENAVQRGRRTSELSFTEKEQQIRTELQCVRDKIAQLEAHPSASASSSQEGNTGDREMLRTFEKERESELKRVLISKRYDQFFPKEEASLQEEGLPAHARDYLEKLRQQPYEKDTVLGTLQDIEKRYTRAGEEVSNWRNTLAEHQHKIAKVRRDMILQRTGISAENFGKLEMPMQEKLAKSHLTEEDHKDLNAFIRQKKSYEQMYEETQYEHTWNSWSEVFYLKDLKKIFEKEKGQYEKARNDWLVSMNKTHKDRVEELTLRYQKDLVDLGTQFMNSMRSPNISRTDREALQNNHEQVKETFNNDYLQARSAENQRYNEAVVQLERDYFSFAWQAGSNIHTVEGMINKRTGLKGDDDVTPRYEEMTTQYSPPYDENREQSSSQRPENTFEQQVTDWGRAGMRALRRLW